MSLTPIVFLPCLLTPSTGMRTIIPFLLERTTSSPSLTSIIATTLPFLSFVIIVLTPFAPLLVMRYCSSGVLFPYPFSVTVRISSPFATSISTTSSPFLSRIPMTPAAVLPIERTSSSLNTHAFPLADEITIFSPPSSSFTFTSSSPSFRFMARIPLERIFL